MGNHRDGKRTAAQFLNVVAVAIVSIGILGPVLTGNAESGGFALPLVLTGIVHGAALLVSRS